MFSRPLLAAFLNSMSGLKQTWEKERAFRLEIVVSGFLLLFTIFYEAPSLSKLFVIFSLGIMVITELLNTAIEKANDAFKQGPDPLIKFSKDAGSAAVFVSLFLVIMSLAHLIFG